MSMQNVESYPYRHVRLTKSEIDTCMVQLNAHVLLLTARRLMFLASHFISLTKSHNKFMMSLYKLHKSMSLSACNISEPLALHYHACAFQSVIGTMSRPNTTTSKQTTISSLESIETWAQKCHNRFFSQKVTKRGGCFCSIFASWSMSTFFFWKGKWSQREVQTCA
jgi:hypothetical protein